jgi:16S rRNA (guanine(966)-N(2))-methyltransferase RsmD
LRPTADRVKEALFNIIGGKCAGADFLDLFAGTGAIGIEALSRGAETVLFNDINPNSLHLIKENLKIVPEPVPVRILHLEASAAIQILKREAARFDLVFLDPPFQAGLLRQIIDAIIASGLLKPEGILIAEHPKKLEMDDVGLELILQRNYGDIGLTLWYQRGE